MEDVTIRAVDHDEGAWTVLSVIYLTYGRQWKLTANHEKAEGDFDIWKLIRSFAMSRHCLNNQREIQRLLFQHTLFTELFCIHAFAPSSAEFGRTLVLWKYVDGQKALLRKLVEWQWPASEPKVWLFSVAYRQSSLWWRGAHHTWLPCSFLVLLIFSILKFGFVLYDLISSLVILQLFNLRFNFRKRKLDDPCRKVHYIPWSELASVSLEDLHTSGIDEQIPFLEQDFNSEWLIWLPPYPGFAFWSQKKYTHTISWTTGHFQTIWMIRELYLQPENWRRFWFAAGISIWIIFLSQTVDILRISNFLASLRISSQMSARESSWDQEARWMIQVVSARVREPQSFERRRFKVVKVGQPRTKCYRLESSPVRCPIAGWMSPKKDTRKKFFLS